MKNIRILYEDEDCLAVDKPPGLPVQGGEKVGASLDQLLAESFSPRPLLVHRLDKETSGVILAAKSPIAAAYFQGLFAERRRVKKTYQGIALGIFESLKGTFSYPLEIKGAVKNAKTRYIILAEAHLPEGSFSLLELELETGRTHQIRRHLAQAGHPLAGDDKYGDFALNRSLRKSAGLKHLLLHASRLVIRDDWNDFSLNVSSPMPDRFIPFLPPGMPPLQN